MHNLVVPLSFPVSKSRRSICFLAAFSGMITYEINNRMQQKVDKTIDPRLKFYGFSGVSLCFVFVTILEPGIDPSRRGKFDQCGQPTAFNSFVAKLWMCQSDTDVYICLPDHYDLASIGRIQLQPFSARHHNPCVSGKSPHVQRSSTALQQLLVNRTP